MVRFLVWLEGGRWKTYSGLKTGSCIVTGWSGGFSGLGVNDSSKTEGALNMCNVFGTQLFNVHPQRG